MPNVSVIIKLLNFFLIHILSIFTDIHLSYCNKKVCCVISHKKTV